MALTKEDLSAIALLLENQEIRILKRMDERFAEQEKKFDKKLDARFAEQDKRIDARFAEQDKKLDARFAEQDKKLDARFAEQDKRIDARFAEQDKKLDARFAEQSKEFKNRLREVENAILSEVDRVQEIGEKNMKKLEQRLAKIEAYYRINRNDRDQSALLLRMVLELKEEVESMKESAK